MSHCKKKQVTRFLHSAEVNFLASGDPGTKTRIASELREIQGFLLLMEGLKAFYLRGFLEQMISQKNVG